MATIIEGKQYALASQLTNKNHSMVFVKLTDSALKAIEDYASALSKGNAPPSLKPSIEFRPNNSQGVIKIPSKSNIENEKQSYNFSIKDIQNDGILDCVQQNQNMSMESLGKIMLRMQIHANDDTYQTTKAKMAVAAEQELKKYNTKVINSSDPNVGRKLNMKRSFNSKFSTLNTTSASNSSSMYSNKSMPRFNKFQSNNTLSKNFNTFHSNNNAPLSESIKKSVRENVIHLLGLKPYKLCDLLSKIQERVKEQVDRNAIVSILNTVSTFKDGAYHLNESCWEEVQIDWLHYSKEDREHVQRRNPLIQSSQSDNHLAGSNSLASAKQTTVSSIPNGNSISPPSDGSARSFSSPNSVGASPNLKNSPYNKLKRLAEPMYPGNNSKKFKSDNLRLPVSSNGKSHTSANLSSSAIVSHSSPLDKVNPSNINSSGVSDHESPDTRNYFNSNSNCYKSSISVLNESSNNGIKKTDISNDKEAYNRVNSYPRISGNGSGSINSSPNSSPDSGISHIGNVLSSDSSVNNDSEDYLTKYTKIQNTEQLVQYKSDFNAEFPEYRRLYDYVESVSRQFEELKEMIQAKEEESDEWHDLIRQIFEKYDEVKHKTKYNKANKRLIYLHYKLIHIKNLINEYNRNHGEKISNTTRFLN